MSIGKLLFTVSALLALSGGNVYAQDQGFYLGAGGGRSKANNAGNCSDLSSIFLSGGFTCNSNDTGTGWKVFAGYQFNRYVAAEVSYVNLGEFKISGSGNFAAGPPFLGPSTFNGSDKPTGFSLDAVGTLPITEEFGLIARIGAFRWTLDASATISSSVGAGTLSSSDKPTGTSVDYGIGVKYDFAKDFGVRAELQRFKNIGDEATTGKSDVDLISASLLYRFK